MTVAVWDEEWSYATARQTNGTTELHIDVHCIVFGCTEPGKNADSWEDAAEDDARARLAAAAPDMARALLAMLERPAIDADMPCDDEARAALEKAGVRR